MVTDRATVGEDETDRSDGSKTQFMYGVSQPESRETRPPLQDPDWESLRG